MSNFRYWSANIRAVCCGPGSLLIALLLSRFLGLSFEGYLLRFSAWVSQKQERVRTIANLEDHYPGRSASP